MTVSMGEERKGLLRVIFLVTLVWRETSEAWRERVRRYIW